MSISKVTLESIINILSFSESNHKGVRIEMRSLTEKKIYSLSRRLHKKLTYEKYLRKIFGDKNIWNIYAAFIRSNLNSDTKILIESCIDDDPHIMSIQSEETQLKIAEKSINFSEVDHNILRNIGQWLGDRTKYFLMISCKGLLTLGLMFNSQYYFRYVFRSSFYHNFTNIFIGDAINCMNINSVDGGMMNLPKNLREICFEDYFNDHLNPFVIPSTVLRLRFGESFNRPIENCIPPKVLRLVFGSSFNQDIANCIPTLVTHLVFGNSFNGSIINHLSSSITHLILNNDYGHLSPKCFPELIKYLSIGGRNIVPGVIPQNVKYLICNNKRALAKKTIPSSVKYLAIRKISKEAVPSSVTHLKFHKFRIIMNGDDYRKYIPLSVTHLVIDGSYKFPFIDYLIPSSVTHLTFGESFDFVRSESCYEYNPLKKHIPSSVTHLTFGKYFNRSIKKGIPSSVTHLKFGKNFSHPIKNNIPSSVTHLMFKNLSCIRYFEFDDIPSSVTHLTLRSYNDDLCKQRLSHISHLEVQFDKILDEEDEIQIMEDDHFIDTRFKSNILSGMVIMHDAIIDDTDEN